MRSNAYARSPIWMLARGPRFRGGPGLWPSRSARSLRSSSAPRSSLLVWRRGDHAGSASTSECLARGWDRQPRHVDRHEALAPAGAPTIALVSTYRQRETSRQLHRAPARSGESAAVTDARTKQRPGSVAHRDRHLSQLPESCEADADAGISARNSALVWRWPAERWGLGPALRGLPAWARVAGVMFGVGWGANQFSSLLLAYRLHRGVTESTADALFGVYALGLIPALLVIGPVSDLHGRRGIVRVAGALSVVASLALIAGEHSLAMLYLGRVSRRCVQRRCVRGRDGMGQGAIGSALRSACRRAGRGQARRDCAVGRFRPRAAGGRTAGSMGPASTADRLPATPRSHADRARPRHRRS